MRVNPNLPRFESHGAKNRVWETGGIDFRKCTRSRITHLSSRGRPGLALSRRTTTSGECPRARTIPENPLDSCTCPCYDGSATSSTARSARQPMSQSQQPEPESPQLDAFLRAEVWHRIRPGRDMRDWIREVFTAGQSPETHQLLDEHQPHRTMVMWRIVRATAIIKGLTSEDETLDASTEQTPSPWTHPFLPILTPSTGAALRRERAAKLLQYHAKDQGLPLLPPRTDDRAQLERWCHAAALIASDLGIEKTDNGRLGLQGLLDPALAAHCDVSSGNVIAFEELIFTTAISMMLDHGERATIKHFRTEFGLTRKECLGIVRLAKSTALEHSAASIEEKRSLAEMRLESIIARAKDDLDKGTEMSALKELGKIQGLTRTEPENQALEFAAIVQRVSKRQDAEAMSPGDIKLLDAARVEHVEPITIEAEVVDHDDAEAVAEYDRENQLRQ